MEQIIADFRAANKPPEEPKEEGKQEDQVKKKSATQEKLELLAKDMRRIISRIERKAYKEQIKKLEEEAKAKKEEEEKLKAAAKALDDAQKKPLAPIPEVVQELPALKKQIQRAR